LRSRSRAYTLEYLVGTKCDCTAKWLDELKNRIINLDTTGNWGHLTRL